MEGPAPQPAAQRAPEQPQFPVDEIVRFDRDRPPVEVRHPEAAEAQAGTQSPAVMCAARTRREFEMKCAKKNREQFPQGAMQWSLGNGPLPATDDALVEWIPKLPCLNLLSIAQLAQFSLRHY